MLRQRALRIGLVLLSMLGLAGSLILARYPPLRPDKLAWPVHVTKAEQKHLGRTSRWATWQFLLAELSGLDFREPRTALPQFAQELRWFSRLQIDSVHQDFSGELTVTMVNVDGSGSGAGLLHRFQKTGGTWKLQGSPAIIILGHTCLGPEESPETNASGD